MRVCHVGSGLLCIPCIRSIHCYRVYIILVVVFQNSQSDFIKNDCRLRGTLDFSCVFDVINTVLNSTRSKGVDALLLQRFYVLVL